MEYNLWDEAAKALSVNRTYIKQQFYIAIYSGIKNSEQELIVTTVLKLGSPLSVKARTKIKLKEQQNGIIRYTNCQKTKSLS